MCHHELVVMLAVVGPTVEFDVCLCEHYGGFVYFAGLNKVNYLNHHHHHVKTTRDFAKTTRRLRLE